MLVNTCCVREHAEVKVYGTVGYYCKMKARQTLIGVRLLGGKAWSANAQALSGVDFYGDQYAARAPEIMPGPESGARQERIKSRPGRSRACPLPADAGPARSSISCSAAIISAPIAVPLVRKAERAPGAMLLK